MIENPYGRVHQLDGFFPGTDIRLANGFERTGAAFIDYWYIVGIMLLPGIFDHLFLAPFEIAWFIFNTIVMPSLTGQSLGKRILGLYLVVPVMTRYQGNLFTVPSPLRLLYRLLWHVVDAFPYFPVLFIGPLLPFIMANRQTFADRRARTFVLAPLEPMTGLVRRPWLGSQTWGWKRA